MNTASLESQERLDGLTPHQLIDEIREIVPQYLREVGTGGRVVWPEQIRQRVFALVRLGVPKKKIAELTSIPSATIFFWCKGVSGSRGRGRPPRSGLTEVLPQAAAPEKQPGFLEIHTTEKRSVVGLESLRTVRAPEKSSTPRIELRILSPLGFEFSGFSSIEEAAVFYRELAR
jgi:hypothetical protein